jgi:replicative DNA helicase
MALLKPCVSGSIKSGPKPMVQPVSSLDRLCNADAERAVLGSILLDNGALSTIASLITPPDFYDPANAAIFDAILNLRERDEPIDVVTLAAELRRRERLNAVGGGRYLGELTDAIPTIAHVEAHARIVRDLASRRRALEACETAARMLRSGDTPEAARAHIERQIFKTSDGAPAGQLAEHLDHLFTTIHRRASGDERPLGTPWRRVDTALGGGLWPGLYVLVGGTGAGKTQFAVETAVHAARAGARVLYLALELSHRDIAARALGVVSGEPWSLLLRGALPESTLSEAIHGAESTLRKLPFYTECAPPYGYSIETLSARAWSLKPALVVLDYLQLCGRVGEELRASISRAAYAARAIARDLGAVVLALSSTARENYSKLIFTEDARPDDFVGLGKESGEVEYASDGVLVLTRGAKDGSPWRRLVVAKNRTGPTAAVDLTWDGNRFTEPQDEGGHGVGW